MYKAPMPCQPKAGLPSHLAGSCLIQLDGVASAYYRQGFLQGLEISGLGGLKRSSLGLQTCEFLIYELNGSQLGFALYFLGITSNAKTILSSSDSKGIV